MPQSTYSGDPTSSKKDEVRFLIGDTDSTEFLLQDGEINYLLGLYNDTAIPAAIRGCETIMAKFSRMADEQVGQVKISYSQKAKAYAVMLGQLRQRLAIENCAPYAGGISKVDKSSNDLNANRVKPDFSKHMMENEQIAPWTTNAKDHLNREGD